MYIIENHGVSKRVLEHIIGFGVLIDNLREGQRREGLTLDRRLSGRGGNSMVQYLNLIHRDNY